MNDGDPHAQIAQLEAEIEALAAASERCRKIGLAARAAMAVGGVWLMAILVGAIRPEGMALVGATTAILGGIVTFGSNTGTARQTAAAMQAAETRRAELIDRMALRLV
jgi:hypothetical protein